MAEEQTNADVAEEPGPETAPSVESLQAQLAEERERTQGYVAQLQRALADFQNLKRRTEEQRATDRAQANATAVINILPAIDDLDRAMSTVDATLAGLGWVEGIRHVLRKLEGALVAMGVTEILADGEDFDPIVHEAVSPAPGEAGKVVRVLQKGYRIGDRIIRPAMVMVGDGAVAEGQEA